MVPFDQYPQSQSLPSPPSSVPTRVFCPLLEHTTTQRHTSAHTYMHNSWKIHYMVWDLFFNISNIILLCNSFQCKMCVEWLSYQ